MTKVPDILVNEPVFETVDAEESVWRECRLVWDEEEQVFINKESHPDWILDEHAFPDSTYTVNGTKYGSLDEAQNAAIRGRTGVEAPVPVRHEY